MKKKNVFFKIIFISCFLIKNVLTSILCKNPYMKDNIENSKSILITQPYIERIFSVDMDENEENEIMQPLENKLNASDINKSNVDSKNQPYFARTELNEYNCYVAKYENDEFLATLKKLNIEVHNVFQKYHKYVVFCIKDKKDLSDLKSKGLHVFIEEDFVYSSASTQINPPDHMFYMMNYRNKFFNNTFFKNFFTEYTPLGYIYKFIYGYYHYDFSGNNVMIYMIDTSVNLQNKDLAGRVKNVFPSNIVCSAHGTSTAMLIAGREYGFAKDSLIKVLNILDCNGKVKLSDIIYGLESINRNKRKVALLYFGISGPKSNIFNDLLENLSNKGFVIVTPAGNNGDLGCNFSPGSAPSVINVGSTNVYGGISKFSNFNSCIRIFCLGEDIKISNSKSKEKFIVQGTSYSAAIVTGIISLYLESHPHAEMSAVWKFIKENSELTNGFLVQKIPNFKNETQIDPEYVDMRKEESSGKNLMFYICIIALFLLIAYLIYRYILYRRENSLII